VADFIPSHPLQTLTHFFLSPGGEGRVRGKNKKKQMIRTQMNADFQDSVKAKKFSAFFRANSRPLESM
jgi:hypothetical protein